MSGGRLVVLDRGGRDVKRYPLASGLATLGSAPACDIRVMLPAVSPHHATIAVHNSQTIIRNVGDGETVVNGQSVSVAALRHCDIITLGDRSLRWEYSAPNKRHQGTGDLPAAVLPGTRGAAVGRGMRGVRRGSAGGTPALRDRALQLAIEMTHRASMPVSSGGKQVAIVQPQRRDNHEHSVKSTGVARRSGSKADDSSADSDAEQRATRLTAKTVPLNTTKATMWIESRKWSPRRRVQSPPQAPPAARRATSSRKGTPLRLTVLRKAQSAHKLRVVKIEDPQKIDHTKQAAIMLMTGHTPKSRLSASQFKRSPSYLVKKPSPVRKSSSSKARRSGRVSRETGDGITPRRASTYSHDTRRSKRASRNQSASILELSDNSQSKPPQKSSLSSPKKSALKDLSKKGNRKTESIKFDLSNLESHQESEITSRFDSEDSLSEEELTLRYSESPSPRASHSRSSRMLQKVGTSVPISPSRTLTPNSPSSRKSARSTMLLQKALDNSEATEYSKREDTTVASAFKTRTLSPRAANMESYSIVDLVSIDTDTSKSVYNSPDSTNNTTDFGTPNTSAGRKSRSTLQPTLLGSSTPYVGHARATRSRSSTEVSKRTTRSSGRRSKSLSTPENQYISVNSTRISRASKSRSRINDTDLLLLDDTEPDDSSPKTSRRTRTKSNLMDDSKVNDSVIGSDGDGTITPQNRQSPVEIGTPVLSIQSLLDSSRSSLRSQTSTKKGRSFTSKRKTIGVLSEPCRRPVDKSKSLGMSARQTILRLSKDSSEASDKTDPGAPQPDNEDTVTPKSAVKLVQEAVKNKHSTAKKPQSKRSIIDDLDRSDIVKQLFNSPVKRKLSRSMTEFSRKQLFDDEIVVDRRPTRNTVALMGGSNDNDSISEHSETFTLEQFVSPMGTPSHSPNLSGIKHLFQKNTPENDLTNVRGVRSLLRTHRTRRSVKNDLTNVTGLKMMFRNTPLSDGKKSPSNNLFRRNQRSPNNDLTDVRGVKRLFRQSPNNDLRNVSGVRRVLRKSPRNDLTDVRGVRKMFRNAKTKASLHDVSGIGELFDTSGQSTQNSESLFDQMVGKPTARSVYSKTFATKPKKPANRKGKTLHSSLDAITNNVEEWLEQELQKRFHRDEPSTSKSVNATRNITKEMQNLATSTVDGGDPMRTSRTRNSSIIKKSASEIYSAHTLPIKKRSLIESSIEMVKPKLPIKKRAVVHSTPVKGRVNVTMNASELGRVSPIAAVDKTNGDRDTSLNRTTRQNAITPNKRTLKAKTPQKTPIRLSPEASTSRAIPEVSPKTSKASPKKVEKTPPKRVTRNRKNNNSVANTNKRRSSLVIGRKAPVMSPKADPTTAQESPKKRITRGHQKIGVTPKRTRLRAQKATVVVSKPSPKLKPQAKGKQSKVEEKTKRTRKNTAAEVEIESPKETQPRRTRGKKNEPKSIENETDNVEKPKRGRKAAVIDPPVTKRGRGKATEEVKTPGKSVTKDFKADEKQPKTRGKKLETESIPTETTTRRGRKNTDTTIETKATKAQKAPAANEPKTRGQKVETQSSVESQPVTRGRRAKAIDNTVIPETRGRKRKTVAIEEVPTKITKTETKRGRKAVTVDPTPDVNIKDAVKTRAVKDKDEASEEVKTRGRALKIELEKASTKATRGKKVLEPKESSVPDKRKRKTKVEPLPDKAGKKQSPVAKKAAAGTRARSTRAKPQEVSMVVSGRSRRR